MRLLPILMIAILKNHPKERERKGNMKCGKFVFFMLFFSVTVAATEPVICRDLQLCYDVALLEKELQEVEACYMPRFKSEKLSDVWTAIPLRNPTGTPLQEGLQLKNAIRNRTMLPCKNTLFLEQLPYISSILDDIAALFRVDVGLVRISNVPGYKKIPRHKDGDLFDIDRGKVYRLHIPIVTGENVFFEISGNNYNLEAGRLYYTNVSKNHSVTNNGSMDRIHLVIDVLANSALRDHIVNSQELTPVFSK